MVHLRDYWNAVSMREKMSLLKIERRQLSFLATRKTKLIFSPKEQESGYFTKCLWRLK